MGRQCCLEIAFREGDFAEQLVGFEQVTAAFQEPSQFVDGNLDLARREHRMDFLHILRACRTQAGKPVRSPFRRGSNLDDARGRRARRWFFAFARHGDAP